MDSSVLTRLLALERSPLVRGVIRAMIYLRDDREAKAALARVGAMDGTTPSAAPQSCFVVIEPDQWLRMNRCAVVARRARPPQSRGRVGHRSASVAAAHLMPTRIHQSRAFPRDCNDKRGSVASLTRAR